MPVFFSDGWIAAGFAVGSCFLFSSTLELELLDA